MSDTRFPKFSAIWADDVSIYSLPAPTNPENVQVGDHVSDMYDGLVTQMCHPLGLPNGIDKSKTHWTLLLKPATLKVNDKMTAAKSITVVVTPPPEVRDKVKTQLLKAQRLEAMFDRLEQDQKARDAAMEELKAELRAVKDEQKSEKKELRAVKAKLAQQEAKQEAEQKELKAELAQQEAKLKAELAQQEAKLQEVMEAWEADGETRDALQAEIKAQIAEKDRQIVTIHKNLGSLSAQLMWIHLRVLLDKCHDQIASTLDQKDWASMTWSPEVETAVLKEFATRTGKRRLSEAALKWVTAPSNFVRNLGNRSDHSANEAVIRVAANAVKSSSDSDQWMEVSKDQDAQRALRNFQPFVQEVFEFAFEKEL